MSQRFALHNPDDIGHDVILGAGQSNMVGIGAGLDTVYLDPPDPRIQQYANSGPYANQMIAAIDPLYHHNQQSAVGHLMQFARDWTRTIPANRRVLVVPTAHGSTGFTSSSLASPPAGYSGNADGSWDSTGGAGGVSLYENAIAQAIAALALNPKNRLVAILWHQGEQDTSSMNQAQYAAALDALVTGFRARIPGAATVPFILGQMQLDGITARTSGANSQLINAAHIDTPRRQVNTAFWYAPPAGLTYQNGDNTHFNAAGQRINGRSAFACVPYAKANVLGTPPAVPGAITLAQSGTTVTASWVRPVARVTDYNVRSSVDGGTTWATLTRAQSIDNTATITGLTLGQTVLVQVRSVNEQGSSAWTTSTSLTLVNVPGQVTGLAAGSPGAVTVPLSWTAVTSATSYLVEKSTDGGTTWTSAATATVTTATVTNLAASTAYKFRVSAVNAGGAGTPSSTVSVTTLAFSPILTDMGLAADRALGLRRMSSTATNAIRVRYTDGTEADIGFATSGDLDTATMLAGASAHGGGATVKTLYDQSGNGKDMVQTTVANQPPIVVSNTLVVTSNGKAGCTFDGSHGVFADTTTANLGLYAAGAASTLSVLKETSVGSVQYVTDEPGSTGGYAPLYISSGTVTGLIRDNANVVLVNNGGGANLGTTNAHVISTVDTGLNYSSWVDGAAAANTAYARSGHTQAAPTAFILGGNITSAGNLAATFSELLVFKAALTTTQRQAGESNAKAYYGTP